MRSLSSVDLMNIHIKGIFTANSTKYNSFITFWYIVLHFISILHAIIRIRVFKIIELAFYSSVSIIPSTSNFDNLV
jgi:hypothetical protein